MPCWVRDWHADRGIVLLRAVEPIRVLVVDGDVIELCGELVVDGRPGVAAVVRHTGAAVVALNHALRVGGSIHRSWLSPCGVVTCANVLPPSIDFQHW